MSFTIVCNKCGNETKFFNGDSRVGDKIQFIPDVTSDFEDGWWKINCVDIYCENPECKNTIEIV